ncbi:MAG: long-chain fatty acid--CoA ligase [Chromatiales bacterium]|nr:long-chain fatty acid--CoA ligase [Chromatiales bacterium]
MKAKTDLISPHEAQTLAGLFRCRVEHSPDTKAYLHYDREARQWQSTTWAEMAAHVSRWQTAMKREGLEPGDRVAVMLHNCREWVMFDQAALGLGLVTVPLYADDHPENVAYILKDAGVRLLIVERAEQWEGIAATMPLPAIERVVSLRWVDAERYSGQLTSLNIWLPQRATELQSHRADPDALATIVYTSGTTGRSKGVMLSHTNILFDAAAGLKQVPVYSDDLFLSFLPLSHTLERTAGYIIPMMTGATVAYARSIQELAEDLQSVRPTILVTVPRIFERVYNKLKDQLAAKPPMARRLFELAVEVGWERFLRQQHRGSWNPMQLLWPILKGVIASKVTAKLGGRLRMAVSGGAPLSPAVARVFIGLGLPVVQGYGLTESSPVISVNRLEDNVPDSVGTLLPGVEARTSDEGELWVRGPNVMMGYWNCPEATAEILDSEGWLHTGDKVKLDEGGHIQITGRLKEIMVLSNGEKLPPGDLEQAITMDSLFEQVMVIGEGRPFLAALVVLNREKFAELLQQMGYRGEMEEALKEKSVRQRAQERIEQQMSHFPGYAHIYRVHLDLEPWSIENGLLTPTMKSRRSRILDHYAEEIEQLYAGH